MDKLQAFCRELRKGKKQSAFVFILKTRGCFWAHHSGCTMCGYFNDSVPDITEKEIVQQFELALQKYQGEKIVKIFTSGSFLDEREVPLKMQIKMLRKFFEKADKVIVESRPEFIENISKIEPIPKNKVLEVAMGLESANDRVLKHSINKGVKPPFLTEAEAIKDALLTARKVSDISDTLSFNPVAIHANTLVEYLWSRKLYRPPWLWSVAEILEGAAEIFDGQIKCDVVAGGRRRGAHNCGKCDGTFLKAVERFTLYQDKDAFKKLKCECREEWLDSLEIEGFLKG